MGIFSSNGHHHRNGHLGSGYYQGKSLLGNLLEVIGSRSHPHSQNAYYPPQHNLQLQNGAAPSQIAEVCSKCGSRIPSGSKFCLECGEMVKDARHCTGCGQTLPPGAKFCMNCGKRADD